MKEREASMTGCILNIQHFCVDDGPGIRTTVFFKGCPLRCIWCHNPESHERAAEIFYRSERCRACGACAALCSRAAHKVTPEGEHIYDRSRCIRCGSCVTGCRFHALEMAGEIKTVEEVMEEVCKDRIFYATSQGGVTLSGGEPTAQPQFAEALLIACKAQGIHTCVESCGWCEKEIMRRFLPLTDLFLLDWKMTDDRLHRQYTGVSNRPILENLALMQENGARVILRCPLLPQINMDSAHYEGIAALSNRYRCIERIDLEPYHPMGIGKSAALGKRAVYDNETFLASSAAEETQRYLQRLVTIPVCISGKA